MYCSNIKCSYMILMSAGSGPLQYTSSSSLSQPLSSPIVNSTTWLLLLRLPVVFPSKKKNPDREN